MNQILLPKLDPLGHAVKDFFVSKICNNISVESDLAENEVIPSSYFFRSYNEMPELERFALENCKGKVLDVGAGAGSHSLILQERGFTIDSLEISAICCEVMQMRGLQNVIEGDIFEYNNAHYDTLLFMMNGIGLAGTLRRLEILLQKCFQLLKPGGTVIFDSSDIDYMYYEKDGSKLISLNNKYYGELLYRMHYKEITGNYFPWLFVDFKTLAPIAEKVGFKASLLASGQHYDYIGVLHKNI